MAKVEVELLSSASLSENGRTFHKGRPQLLTNPAEIAQYRNRPGFRFTILEEQPKPVPKPEPKRLPVEPEPKTPISDDDPLMNLFEKGLAETPEIVPETIPEVEEPTNKPPVYKKAKLMAMPKSLLIELGLEWDLAFTGEEKKKTMIADILLAQEENA